MTYRVLYADLSAGQSKSFINRARIRYLIGFIALVICSAPHVTNAQKLCNDDSLITAQEMYNYGNFEGVVKLLESCGQWQEIGKNDESTALQIKAYRLLANTYAELDDSPKAREYTRKILDMNTDFITTEQDDISLQEFISEYDKEKTVDFISSVSKSEERLHEAPATVMVITQTDIRDRGYVDLEALFSDLPGFDVSRTIGSTYSNIYQRGYRSDNTNRTLLLIDGVEESDLYYGQAYISRQYPISNVERVEVVYGPASTMYGANAFLGVVNIITKEPDQFFQNQKIRDDKVSIGVSGNAGAGSYNTYYGDLSLAATKGKGISFSITGRGFFSDEMDLSAYPEFDYNPADYDTVNYSALLSLSEGANVFADTNNLGANPFYSILTDASGDTTSVVLTAAGEAAARKLDKEALNDEVGGNPVGYSNVSQEYFVNAKLRLPDVLFSYTTWKYVHGSTNYINDGRRPGANNATTWSPEQSVFYVKYNKQMERISLTNISMYKVSDISDDSRLTDLKNYANGGIGASSFAAGVTPYWLTTYFYQTSRQFRNELKMAYKPTDNWVVISGLELRHSSIYGDFRKTESDSASAVEIGTSTLDNEPGSNEFTIKDIGLYAQANYVFSEDLKLTLGGRYDNNTIRVTGGYGGVFNPRIALVATPGNFIFKGIYATAFKDASNFQKFSTSDQRQLTNPNLKPERVSNFELSTGYEPDKSLFADVAAYYSLYSGAIGTKIVPYGTGTTGIIDAIGSSRIFGIQSTLSYKMSRYNVYWNYTYCHPQSEILDNDGNPTGAFQRIGDISSHRTNFGVNGKFLKDEQLNVNLRMNFWSERPVGPGTSVPLNPSNFPAHALFNGAVAYDGLLSGLRIQLAVNNLLNTEYFDPGIRDASGLSYTYRTPQRGRNYVLRLIFDIN